MNSLPQNPLTTKRPIVRYDSLIGKRFNRWVVLDGPIKIEKSPHRFWRCQCDCGTVTVVVQPNLIQNISKSCGCWNISVIKARRTTHGFAKNYHKDKLYRTWTAMRNRCNNPKTHDYKWYGAKGITICKEWDDHLQFRTWALTHGYADNLTIDRIKSHLNYCPTNCQWITQSENAKKANREKRERLAKIKSDSLRYNHALAE